MMTRLIDFLKLHNITAFLTNLNADGEPLERTDVDISSLVDTWIVLRDMEAGGERNRILHVLKSRGMAHSNQLREFLLTDHGIELLDVYLGPKGVLTGSLRLAQEAREYAQALAMNQEIDARQRASERKREALEARIAALRKEFEAEAYEAQHELEVQQQRVEVVQSDRRRMARSRKADFATPSAEQVKPGNKSRGTRK
jgi:circadian clock protein KaiC